MIRSDNGREFIAETLAGWLQERGVDARAVEKASPQQNAFIETFHRTQRRELLDWESFDTLLEARVVINQWRERYNRQRAHSSLAGRTPTEAYKYWKEQNPGRSNRKTIPDA